LKVSEDALRRKLKRLREYAASGEAPQLVCPDCGREGGMPVSLLHYDENGEVIEREPEPCTGCEDISRRLHEEFGYPKRIIIEFMPD
jgi:hypothetical protein